MSQPTFKRLALGVTTAAFGIATLTANAKPAQADEIQGTPKAIIGGAFLGAEVVAIPMGIAGVRAGWAYAVFPGLGAIAGGIGGYFMDKAYDDAAAANPPGQSAYGSAFMLAGGMALIIPTIVLILNATRYHPNAEATEDKAPTGPPANPGQPGGSVVTPSSNNAAPAGGAAAPATTTPASSSSGGAPAGGADAAKAPYVPLSLVDVHEGAVRMGLPVPEVRYSYSLREVKEFGVPRTTEVRVPVFHLAF
jgi:hypothetical protein